MQRSLTYFNGLATQTTMMIKTQNKFEERELKIAKQLSELTK